MDKFTLIYNANNDAWQTIKKYMNEDFTKESTWNKLIRDFELLKAKYAKQDERAAELVGKICGAILIYLDDNYPGK